MLVSIPRANSGTKPHHMACYLFTQMLMLISLHVSNQGRVGARAWDRVRARAKG